MKKNKSYFYSTLIFLVNILVYLFKIDREVFAFQERICHPHQTRIDQPLSKETSGLTNIFSDFIPLRIVSILHKLNVSHKSSADEDPACCLFA